MFSSFVSCLRPFNLRNPHAADFLLFAKINRNPARTCGEIRYPSRLRVTVHCTSRIVAALVELAGHRVILFEFRSGQYESSIHSDFEKEVSHKFRQTTEATESGAFSGNVRSTRLAVCSTLTWAEGSATRCTLRIFPFNAGSSSLPSFGQLRTWM